MKSIRFLSPQQSVIIVYIFTQNSPVNSAEWQGESHLIDYTHPYISVSSNLLVVLTNLIRMAHKHLL